MPTLFIIRGFRFFFFSDEGSEPIHIHIEKAGKYAKFWINPVCLARNYRFTSAELRKIMDLIELYKKKIEEEWHEYFKVK